MITLKCTDRKNTDGSDILQSFEDSHAQRILDVKHPARGWVLCDDNYILIQGVITRKPTFKPETAPVITK